MIQTLSPVEALVLVGAIAFALLGLLFMLLVEHHIRQDRRSSRRVHESLTAGVGAGDVRDC